MAHARTCTALFDLIVDHVPGPETNRPNRKTPFRMLATTLGSDPFIGRILTGRVESGTPESGATVSRRSAAIGTLIEKFRASKILAFPRVWHNNRSKWPRRETL